MNLFLREGPALEHWWVRGGKLSLTAIYALQLEREYCSFSLLTLLVTERMSFKLIND